MSNVFAIKENNLYTPDLSQSGVNGIMRDMIIAAAGRNNIQVSMLNLKLEDLYEMEEIFISNSLMCIRSVNKIDASLYQQQTLTKFMLSELLKTKDDHVQIVN
jgi:4-amino-4-deoxychorismate lyase